MQFFKYAMFVVAAVTVGTKADISCQDQGNARGAICVYGSCPPGWRSVFYDYGCEEGQRCCI